MTFKIEELSSLNEGTYRCRASNDMGVHSVEFPLKVLGILYFDIYQLISTQLFYLFIIVGIQALVLPYAGIFTFVIVASSLIFFLERISKKKLLEFVI